MRTGRLKTFICTAFQTACCPRPVATVQTYQTRTFRRLSFRSRTIKKNPAGKAGFLLKTD
ncbi:hypothetical protein HMPREF9120_00275 [Neisseria sp. oral taxon 020 str. F0370]|nr:hypothetical protein HMPREF9120_00275 [Neisseria sp. oral taxon 020 str. F0370]